MMCSQSVSGSSLLSGYNEEDVRERSGRSRREFEEIDAVLYDEEKSKRATIKKICEEWSSKPHFRIRGRLCQIDRQSKRNSIQLHRAKEILGLESTGSSSFDFLAGQTKDSNVNPEDLTVLLNENNSGRSSIDSIEGSELTNNSDLDDNEADEGTNTPLNEHFTDASVDSFDTDEDDDDEEYDGFSSGVSNRDRVVPRRHRSRTKQPQLSIKCMKDSIVNNLASILFRRFISEQQTQFQHYAKLVCERNAIKLRPKLRPYSLPPRSLSQNRYSLPANPSISGQGALLQLSPFQFRATPEPDSKLTSLLLVTPIRITTASSTVNQPTSPRKSQVSGQLLPPAPPPQSFSIGNERSSLAPILSKPNAQQISLIGTAMMNLPPQLTMVSTQVSQTPIRQSASAWRYRSATTTTNTIVQNNEPNTRLPPINIERITSNEQVAINRSNTMTNNPTDSMGPSTRVVSGTSTGSNISSNVKPRTLISFNKVSKQSRPITISSINPTKDLNHPPSSTSPARSTTTTITPSSILRTTTANRTQQQTKRPVLTTKAPPPPPPSTVIKIPAPHIY